MSDVKIIRLPVLWKCRGYVYVKANNIAAAIELFETYADGKTDLETLPVEGTFVEDSLELGTDDLDEIDRIQTEP